MTELSGELLNDDMTIEWSCILGYYMCLFDTKLLVKTLLVSFNRNILPGILFINSTFANIFLFEKCIVILNQTLSAKIDIGKY